jgi:hypothetical protein
VNRKYPKILRNRKRRIQRRLDPERRWSDAEAPMMSPTNIHFEMAERSRAVNYGGIGAMHACSHESMPTPPRCWPGACCLGREPAGNGSGSRKSWVDERTSSGSYHRRKNLTVRIPETLAKVVTPIGRKGGQIARPAQEFLVCRIRLVQVYNIHRSRSSFSE